MHCDDMRWCIAQAKHIHMGSCTRINLQHQQIDAKECTWMLSTGVSDWAVLGWLALTPYKNCTRCRQLPDDSSLRRLH